VFFDEKKKRICCNVAVGSEKCSKKKKSAKASIDEREMEGETFFDEN
jgi:hypothetical protein